MQPLVLNKNPANKLRDPDTLTIILISILCLYFLGKTLYFALNIGVNISPDETTWIGLSLIFSKSFFLPIDSPSTYEYGLVTHIPYLYVWLMGKAAHLNFFGISDLVFLRFINIGIGLGSLWFGWKTIALLTERNITRLLFMVLCTNTLMLTFLNSFVSYDNLVNFFAVASLYFLLVYFQHKSISDLLLCVLLLLAGCLTKLSFLPFAVLVFIVFMLKERNGYGDVFAGLKSCFLFTDLRQSTLLVMCLFLLALNVNLHLGNIVKFRTLSPSPEAVIGLENAMQYRVFARNYIVRQFKEDQLNLTDARRKAVRYIQHEGDLYGAFLLLDRASQEKLQNQAYRLDRFSYAFPWMNLAMSKIFGIMGHKGMEKTGTSLIPFMLIFLIAGVLMIRQLKLSDMNGNAVFLLTIFVGYTLVIMQYVNYTAYNKSGVIVLGLQGRYLFPVIYAGYALAAYYLTSFRSHKVNILVAAIVAAVFMAGEFPWFLRHVTPDWYFGG